MRLTVLVLLIGADILNNASLSSSFASPVKMESISNFAVSEAEYHHKRNEIYGNHLFLLSISFSLR